VSEGRQEGEGVKNILNQEPPPQVAPRPKASGESRPGATQLSLGSSAVWTERMLAALERGITGGKWHSLIDKVWEAGNLELAGWAVIRKDGSAGVDGESCKALAAHLSEITGSLSRQLREDRYVPQPVKRVWIPKPGTGEKRPLGVPVVRDRVVQTALLYVLEPIFEREFSEQSYGFRPERNARQAVERVERLLHEGQVWVVDADLKGYFDSIPQEKLLDRVAEKVADGRVLRLLRGYLEQGVMDTAKGWQPTEQGTPQGAVISPLLANIYLDPLDHQMAAAGWEMTRYADDFIVQCRSRAEAQAALEQLKDWVQAAGLTLHPQKTRIVDASQPGGFDFLGWHFERGWKWPREKSEQRLRESVRQQTRRTEGRAMGQIIRSLNRRLKGWANYFQGGNGNSYTRLDQWIRMRLRSVQRKRDRRKGRGRGQDHNRYPNAYWADLGLISLKALAQGKLASPA
jgi:RNA-directed DNA polymerase